MNNADFAAMMKQKRDKNRENNPQKNFSEDFKIALQAMTLLDDYEILKSQFFQGN